MSDVTIGRIVNFREWYDRDRQVTTCPAVVTEVVEPEEDGYGGKTPELVHLQVFRRLDIVVRLNVPASPGKAKDGHWSWPAREE